MRRGSTLLVIRGIRTKKNKIWLIASRPTKNKLCGHHGLPPTSDLTVFLPLAHCVSFSLPLLRCGKPFSALRPSLAFPFARMFFSTFAKPPHFRGPTQNPLLSSPPSRPPVSLPNDTGHTLWPLSSLNCILAHRHLPHVGTLCEERDSASLFLPQP